MQESEQQLELKKAHMNNVVDNLTNKIKVLRSNETSNESRILRTEAEKESLATVSEDSQVQLIEPNEMQRIEASCLELYVLCKGLSKKTLGKGEKL